MAWNIRKLGQAMMCKAFGHQWELQPSTHRKPQFGYYEPCRCIREGSERLFTIDANGHVISRRYIHSAIYKEVLAMKLDRAAARTLLRKAKFYDRALRAV